MGREGRNTKGPGESGDGVGKGRGRAGGRDGERESKSGVGAERVR